MHTTGDVRGVTVHTITNLQEVAAIAWKHTYRLQVPSCTHQKQSHGLPETICSSQHSYMEYQECE
jgi:hypothetical protein